MKRALVNRSLSGERPRRHPERGVALLTSLLLLLLISAMVVAMVLSTNSDMLINGYNRSFRGAFYAADSGLNIARQDLVNQLLAAGSGTFSGSVGPISQTAQTNVAAYINNTYGKSFQSLNKGKAASSWAEQFQIDPTKTTLTLASCQPVGAKATGTCAAATNATGYSYLYNYTLTAMGRSQGKQVSTIDDSGSVTINVTGTGSATTTSFAAWGTFLDQYAICSAPFAPGTLTGPFFTNGAWTFTDSGPYIFTDSVGSVSADAGYQFSTGSCDKVAASSDSKKNGKTTTTIAPTFQSGFNLNQPALPLPQNDYSQKRAVLDSTGSNTNPVTNADLNSVLKNVTGSAYPSGGASSGVYLPYTTDSSGQLVFTGGGIYVEGSASVQLSTSGTSAQVYKITQGGTVTTITIDSASNTTVINSGGTTKTISGVPVARDPSSGGVTGDATMLYVNGSVTGLAGPAAGQPAIQDGAAVTITAASNVTITGDILYKTEPVTQTQNQIPGTPADTLIPGNDKGQVLGIFTNKGDVQINTSQKNIEIDASIAMISQGGTGGWINTGSAVSNITLVGGRIANTAKACNCTSRNIFFDRRFSQNGFAPPWYPSTTVAVTGPSAATYFPTIQRLRWLNHTGY